ncbi:MAG: hypothetical protein FWC91_00920 [Defluviitaleaceae bacterium]|nr:hypothetical protein [Defluviitaleaceae bacterium]
MENRSKNRNYNQIVIILLLVALLLGIVWGANQQSYSLRYPDFTSFSNGDYGVSLLFDTLNHMQYPVSTMRRPIREASLNDVVLIIQPTNPGPTRAVTEDILSWVYQGGRIIYLENSIPNSIDLALSNHYASSFGGMRWYHLGMGEILTGRADLITNINLMYYPVHGEGIANALSYWNSDRILFAEYYHGFHNTPGTFSQMPVGLRLITIQLIIGGIIAAWHFGKRFGYPIPLYEELEREENEQVLVLARLYKKARR